MHILVLSRFNCVQRYPGSGRAKTRMNARRFDSDWQERRLELMHHFTAPSIKSQTDNNFSWHVFVQVGTSLGIRNEIEAHGAHVVPVKTDDVDAAQALVRKRQGMIATVNLDTDDAVVPNFLERFRVEVKSRNETMVFLRGMRYRPIPPWGAATKSKTNPFNMRVEKHAQIAETVFASPHGKADKIIDTGQMMWMQVVHGENMDNLTLKRTRKDKNMSKEALSLFNFIPMSYYGR